MRKLVYAALATVVVALSDPSPLPGAVLPGPAGSAVTLLAAGLLRVQIGPRDDRPSFQVTNRRAPSVPWHRADSQPGKLRLTTAQINLTLQPAHPCPVQFSCRGQQLVEWCPDGLRGPAELGAPVSPLGMYVLDDSATARLGPGLAGREWWQHPTPNATDLYLLCYGKDFQLGMSYFTQITGRPPLMPAAAYGVWYSGCCIPGLYNQTAVTELILAPYADLDLPLDVFVFDFFWHKQPGWGGYSWDRTRFPQWQQMLGQLKSGNSAYGAPIKTINNLHPNGYMIGPQTEPEGYSRFAAAMGKDPGTNQSFICDFYDQQYMEALQTALLSRVEDWPWVDCSCTSRQQNCCTGANKTGTALQPVNLDFQLMTNFALYSMMTSSGRRGLVLNRLPGRGDGSNYNDLPLNGSCTGPFGSCLRGNLGAHRYPGAWTGDIGDDPAHLVNSVALLPAACAGHLWCAYSVDLGPYSDALPADGAVNAARYIRYMQWGAFSAIFRPHDGGNADSRIWTFGHETYVILRDITRLRGAITPWVYQLAASTHQTSVPFARPMWWDWPDEAPTVPGQFMFGQVLVRPITQFVSPANATPPFSAPGVQAVNRSQYTVWLPPGCWLGWDGSSRHCGPKYISAVAGLDQLPLFVPPGTVIPMWPPGRRLSPAGQRTRLWAVFAAAASGNGSDYEDDGESIGSNSSVTKLEFVSAGPGSLSANISRRISGWFNGFEPSKIHALQLRGWSSISASDIRVECCTGGSCTQLRAGVEGDYRTAGIWTQGKDGAEMASTAGAIIVVCPPSSADLQIHVI